MKSTRIARSQSASLRVAASFALLIVGLASSCGRSVEQVDPALEVPATVEHTTLLVVHDVGGAPADASEMADWALDRFRQVGLRLPDRVAVTFDVTGLACDGAPGRCRPDADPPEAIICEPDGTTAFRVMNRRITLLHELAHIWHWHRRNGWSDESSTVGGVLGDGEVDWHDRMAERVAVLVSWGLLEAKRRPVQTELHCATLYAMFERLTGHAPLGELRASCLPDQA